MGGAVRIRFPSGFSAPEYLEKPWCLEKDRDFTLPGYTSITVSRPGSKILFSKDGYRYTEDNAGADPSKKYDQELVELIRWRRLVFLTVAGEALQPGDVITIVFGDTVSGSAGAVTAAKAGPVEFSVAVDPDGRHLYHPIEVSPKLNVVSDAACELIVTADTNAVVGKAVAVTVVARDKFDNVVESYEGGLSLSATGNGIIKPDNYTFRLDDSGVHCFKDALVLGEAGVQSVTVVDPANGLEAKSNPVRVTEKARKYSIFWGDIHGHSEVSIDARGSLEQYFTYARDVAKLDFSAVTDHDSQLEVGTVNVAVRTEAEWEKIKKVTGSFNKEHAFVTFYGYEFSRSTDGTGHRNVYYLKDNQPLYNSFDPETNTISKLWSKLADSAGEAMIVPHLHAGANWDLHNPKLERLLEVYSEHGNFEYYGCPRKGRKSIQDNNVQTALAKGFKFGLVASSDDHVGQPGWGQWGISHFPHWSGVQYHNGIVAVYAESLTREAVWEALWNRRCYATTGARVILDFSINGHMMGEEIEFSSPNDARREVSVSVAAPARIKQIDLVKNNIDLVSHEGKSEQERFEYIDNSDLETSDYYYVRVTLEDGNLAWSSPIYVN